MATCDDIKDLALLGLVLFVFACLVVFVLVDFFTDDKS